MTDSSLATRPHSMVHSRQGIARVLRLLWGGGVASLGHSGGGPGIDSRGVLSTMARDVLTGYFSP